MMKTLEILKPAIYYHPGEELNEKLQEMDMSVAEFAKITMIPESVVACILNGEVSVTADIACALEQVTHIPARLWINMQHNYDDYILENKRASWRERLSYFSQRVASVLI